jgi:hypothetical protein
MFPELISFTTTKCNWFLNFWINYFNQIKNIYYLKSQEFHLLTQFEIKLIISVYLFLVQNLFTNIVYTFEQLAC